jgi:membrane-associated HD superfamily phosphohydrolase
MVEYLINLMTISNYLNPREMVILYTIVSVGVIIITVYNTKYRTLKQAIISRILLVVFLGILSLLLLNVVISKFVHSNSVVLYSIPFALFISYLFLKDIKIINNSRKI